MASNFQQILQGLGITKNTPLAAGDTKNVDLWQQIMDEANARLDPMSKDLQARNAMQQAYKFPKSDYTGPEISPSAETDWYGKPGQQLSPGPGGPLKPPPYNPNNLPVPAQEPNLPTLQPKPGLPAVQGQPWQSAGEADFTVDPQGRAAPRGFSAAESPMEAGINLGDPKQIEYKPGLGFKGEGTIDRGIAAAAAEDAALAGGKKGIFSTALRGLGAASKAIPLVGEGLMAAEAGASSADYMNNAHPGFDEALRKQYGMSEDAGVGQKLAFKAANAPGMMAATLAELAQKGVGEAKDWWSNPNYGKSKAGQQLPPGVTPVEAAARLLAMKDNSSINSTGSFDTGQSVMLPPASPQMGAPQGVDTHGMDSWLDKAQPKAPDAAQGQENTKLALVAGLLQGLAGGNFQSGHLGELLAGAGAGAVGGYAQGKQNEQQLQQKYQLAEQNYATLRAGHSLDVAKLDADHQNALLDVAFKNAMLAHSDALEAIKLTQPQFKGMENGVAVYQTVDPQTGQIQIKSFDTGILRQQAILKGMMRKNSGNGVIGDLTASATSPAGGGSDPFGFYATSAAEVLNGGVAPIVLGEKLWTQLDNDARAQAMTTPGSDSEKNATYKQYVLGHMAGYMMNSPAIVQQAAAFSSFARAASAIMGAGR